ncbi:hypothetical protein MMC27_000685 [Xylographa pallens]|nr:hypothetical protein [Xylographa pallens]
MAMSAPNSPRPNLKITNETAASTISLPAILNSIPRDNTPVTQVAPSNNRLSVRPRSNNDDDISHEDHVLRYTRAGRFWKPFDEAAQRPKESNWKRWSNRGDGVASKRRLSAFTAPVHEVQEETYLYRENLTVLLPHRYQFDQPTTDDGTSSISDGSSSRLSRHASSVASVRRMRSLKATDMPIREMPMVQPESLAQRIAKDERQSKTAEQLRKLQNDEENRLAQLRQADEEPCVSNSGGVILVPSQTGRSSSRRPSDASSMLPSQPQAAHNPPVPSPSANDDLIQIMDDLQFPATSASSYWTDLQELNSMNDNDYPEPKAPELTGTPSTSGQHISNLHPEIRKTHTSNESPSHSTRSSPIAELPPNSISPTSDLDSASLPVSPSPEPDSNDLFAELNSLISALPPRNRTTIASPSSTSSHLSDWSTSPLQPTRTASSPRCLSASSLYPTEPLATDCFELSASPSVHYRPPRRDVHQQYRRTRQHSDLGVYNTLPHEPYPLLPADTYAELPAREYESDRRDLYAWDSRSGDTRAAVVVAPDWNPITG